MKQKTVAFDDATLSDLKMFSAQLLNVTVPNNILEGTLRAKIRAAFQGDEITIMVPDVDESGPADAPAEAPIVDDSRALRPSSSRADPKVKVTIAKEQGAGGNRGVFVGVNGVGMIVPRGIAVEIPWRYWHAFELATRTQYEQLEDGDVISTDMPSYPISVNRMPPQAEIDAYLALERTPVSDDDPGVIAVAQPAA